MAEGDPARRAAAGVAEARDGEDEEPADAGEHGVRQLVEPVVVHEAEREEDRQPDRGVGRLALQEELRSCMCSVACTADAL